MTEPPAPTLSDYGRGMAGAMLGLLAFVSIGAAFFGAPGDARGAIAFAPVLLLAIVAAVRTRAATRSAVGWLIVLAVAQGSAAAWLLYTRAGTSSVVLTITGLFVAGWLAAALLLHLGRAAAVPPAK